MKTDIGRFLGRGAPLLQIPNDRVFVKGADPNRKVINRPGGVPFPDGQVAVLAYVQTDSGLFIVLVQHRQINTRW